MGWLQDRVQAVTSAVERLPVAQALGPGGAVDQAITALPLTKQEATAGAKAAATAFVVSGGNPAAAAQAGAGAVAAQHAKDRARAAADVGQAVPVPVQQGQAGGAPAGPSSAANVPLLVGLGVAAKILFF
jgi:hypothetical protein